jgi:hypothetical protein
MGKGSIISIAYSAGKMAGNKNSVLVRTALTIWHVMSKFYFFQ